MKEEVWKDIPGYEGRYQASTMGSVRSLDRVQKTKKGHRHYKGKVLRPGGFCKSGHVSVVLGHGKSGSPVHQLVALTFLGPCPKGKEVLHGDGNPKNNKLDNLRYGTRSENIIDVSKQGGVWRKLSLADVIEIKHRLALGEPCKVIAKDFSVTLGAISKIKMGVNFKWVEI